MTAGDSSGRCVLSTKKGDTPARRKLLYYCFSTAICKPSHESSFNMGETWRKLSTAVVDISLDGSTLSVIVSTLMII